MPHPIPVPSRNALRALRHLAFGTSCTVVLGTVALTAEDRRRRIAFAETVCENKRRIRAVRNYHNVAAGATVEGVDAYMMPNGVAARFFAEQEDIPHEELRPQVRDKQGNENAGSARREPAAQRLRHLEPLQFPSSCAHRPTTDEPHAILEASEQTPEALHDDSLSKKHDKAPVIADIETASSRLAADVRRYIGDGSDVRMIECATERLVEALSDGRRILHRSLLDAIILLTEACYRHSCFDQAYSIIMAVDAGDSDMPDILNSLGSATCIDHFCQIARHANPAEHGTRTAALQKAAALYEVLIRRQSSLDAATESLGHTLCDLSCQTTSMEICPTLCAELKSRGVQNIDRYMVMFLHATQRHREALDTFLRLYKNPQTWDEFKRILELTLISASKSDVRMKTTDIVTKLASLIRENEQTLAEPVSLDIARLYDLLKDDQKSPQEIYTLLVPLLPWIAAPCDLFGQLAWLCLRKGNQAESQKYLDELSVRYAKALWGRISWRSVVLQHAVTGQWEKAVSCLEDMKCSRRFTSFQVADIFAGVLSAFVRDHSLGATTEFLQQNTERLKIPISQSIFHMMIKLYTKGRDVESLCRWLKSQLPKFTPAIAARLMAVTFVRCCKSWNLTAGQARQLYFFLCKTGRDVHLRLDDRLAKDFLIRWAIRHHKKEPGRFLAGCSNAQSRHQSWVKTMDGDEMQFHMSRAIAMGKPQEALQLWEVVQEHRLHLRDDVVLTAVRASLSHHRKDLLPAITILRSLDKRSTAWRDALSLITIRHLRGSDKDPASSPDSRRSVLKTALITVKLMEQEGHELSLALIAHIANLHVRRGMPKEALDFWFKQLRGRENVQLDFFGLFVCLKAYLALEDVAGLEWVVTMANKYGVAPDKQWYEVLYKVLRRPVVVDARSDFRDAVYATLMALQSARRVAAAAKTRVMTEVSRAFREIGDEVCHKRGIKSRPPRELKFATGEKQFEMPAITT